MTIERKARPCSLFEATPGTEVVAYSLCQECGWQAWNHTHLAKNFPVTSGNWTEPVHVGMADDAELPVVTGTVGPDGKVRVDEESLEPGRYRVRAGEDGEIVGEVEVTDPRLYKYVNRAERRGHGGKMRFRKPVHPMAGVVRRSR